MLESEEYRDSFDHQCDSIVTVLIITVTKLISSVISGVTSLATEKVFRETLLDSKKKSVKAK